jgi:hypothetical protein
VTTTELNNIVQNERRPWLQEPENGLDVFVKLNWFMPQSLLQFPNPEMAKASCNLYVCDNIELFQTKRYSWLLASDLLELCFVFQYADVIDGKYCIEGMMNAFYALYRYVDKSTIEPICKEGDQFFAFPSFFPTFSVHWCHCWSTEVWDSLIMAQQAITGLLCRYSQSQGKRPSARSRTSIPAAVMYYISLWLQNRNVFPAMKQLSRFQKHVRSGIIFRKMKKEVLAWCWRFDTDYKLEVLSQLLGRNIAV